MSLKNLIIDSPIYDLFGKRSFGQSGEDIIVASEIVSKKKGFYVDVGAFHPKQFSNTYFFYKKGWSGLVVEPNQKLCRLFEKLRPRDVCLNVGVGKKEAVMDYFMMNDPATNTFSKEEAEESVKKAGRKIIGKRPVAVLPLIKILNQYVPKGKEIDLLSVDAEGMDHEILESNDWKAYRPRIVICEDMDVDIRNWKKSRVMVLLDEKGYELLGMTPYSLIFRRREK